MTLPTRPMLAATATSADLEKLRYPLLASPKLDGIRCLVHPQLGPVTRSFKPVPNAYIREVLNKPEFFGLDGELMLINLNGFPLDFNSIQSGVMSQNSLLEGMLEFWVFDHFLENTSFQFRYQKLSLDWKAHEIVRPLKQSLVFKSEEALAAASTYVSMGYEGMVLRDLEGAYKSGRSTLKQQGMIKYKEFQDAEGIIVDFEEKFHNDNPDEKDNFGLAKRPVRKDLLRPANTLGALVLNTTWGTLRVGTGFDDSMREHIWQHKADFVGRTVTFKYQTHGMQSLPRFPVFLRFREGE